jgi:hypothetical protein
MAAVARNNITGFFITTPIHLHRAIVVVCRSKETKMTDRLADLKRGAAVAENGNDGMSSTRVAKGTAESTINQLHPGQGRVFF